MQAHAAMTVLSAINVMLAQSLHVSTSAYLSIEASGCAEGYLLLSGLAAHHRRCSSFGAPSPSAKMGTYPASSTCGSLGFGGAGSCNASKFHGAEGREVLGSDEPRLPSCHRLLFLQPHLPPAWGCW